MAKESKAERTERLVSTLRSRAEQFRESDERYRRFLQSAGRFHNYSLSNQWLIFAQCPQASAINSFKRWLSLGRCVRKGETAIWILAPRPYKQTKADGTEEEKLGFAHVPVFDYSQTEPLEDAEDVWEPFIFPTLTEETGGDYVDGLLAQLREQGHHVETFTDARSYRGRFSPAHDGEASGIELNVAMPMLQQLNTLVHEIAHLEHWSIAPMTMDTFRKGEVEFIAESASYAVLNQIGFDTSDKSVAYIGAMLKDHEESEVREKVVMGMVVRVVDRIMDRLSTLDVAASSVSEVAA